MKLINLKKVMDYEVREWIESSIPDLSPYQKEAIRDKQIIKFAPFYFMKPRKKIDSIPLRFTIIFLLPVLLIIIISLPFNFLITGNWGYKDGQMSWVSKWITSCGF